METDNITMHEVKSSQIKAVGHDPATGRLRIQFQDRKDGTQGSIYEYEDVEPWRFDELLNAKSAGAYFGEHIKMNPKYPHKRFVKETPPEAA